MPSFVRFAFTASLLLFPALAAAQERGAALTLKGGVTIEDSEDGLTGTAPAFGVAVSRGFAPRWRGEFEFWLPGYLKDSRGEPKHRDVLFSGAVIREFSEGNVRPFVVAGLSFSRTEDRFNFCTADRVTPGGGPIVRASVDCAEPDIIERREERNTGTDLYLLGGGGLTVAAGSRVRIVADVRLALAPTSLLVRPGVGISFGF